MEGHAEEMFMDTIDRAVIQRIIDALSKDSLTPGEIHVLFHHYVNERDLTGADPVTQAARLKSVMDEMMYKLVPALDTIWGDGGMGGKEAFIRVSETCESPMIWQFLNSCPAWITRPAWGKQVIASLVDEKRFEAAELYVRKGFSIESFTVNRVLSWFALHPKKKNLLALVQTMKNVDQDIAIDFVEVLLRDPNMILQGVSPVTVAAALAAIDPNETEIDSDVLYRAARTSSSFGVVGGLMDHCKRWLDCNKLFGIISRRESKDALALFKMMNGRGFLVNQSHPALFIDSDSSEAFQYKWNCPPPERCELDRREVELIVYNAFGKKDFMLDRLLREWEPARTLDTRDISRDMIMTEVESYVPEHLKEQLAPMVEKLKARFDVQ